MCPEIVKLMESYTAAVHYYSQAAQYLSCSSGDRESLAPARAFLADAERTCRETLEALDAHRKQHGC